MESQEARSHDEHVNLFAKAEKSWTWDVYPPSGHPRLLETTTRLQSRRALHPQTPSYSEFLSSPPARKEAHRAPLAGWFKNIEQVTLSTTSRAPNTKLRFFVFSVSITNHIRSPGGFRLGAASERILCRQLSTLVSHRGLIQESPSRSSRHLSASKAVRGGGGGSAYGIERAPTRAERSGRIATYAGFTKGCSRLGSPEREPNLPNVQ